MVDEVPLPVAAPGLHEREVGVQRQLEHVRPAVDDARLLPLGHGRAEARRREEAADAGATGADPFGQRSLGHELDVELPGQELPFEFLVLTDVARNHLLHLPRAQQDADAEVVDAGVVADDGEVLGATLVQRLDQVLGDAAQPEPAHHDGRPVGDQGHRFVSALQNLVHSVGYATTRPRGALLPGGREPPPGMLRCATEWTGGPYESSTFAFVAAAGHPALRRRAGTGARRAALARRHRRSRAGVVAADRPRRLPRHLHAGRHRILEGEQARLERLDGPGRRNGPAPVPQRRQGSRRPLVARWLAGGLPLRPSSHRRQEGQRQRQRRRGSPDLSHPP